MSEIVKIPFERIKILLGSGEETKKMIESKCNVELEIDKEEGDVEIIGEPTEIFFAKDVVKAIGRGFSPNDALKLNNGDYNFILINMKELFSSDNAITRLKGRVIGENGKTKSEIEAATESCISVYGNTIGIIASIDTIGYAKEAVMILLDGAPHNTLMLYLGKSRREIMALRLGDLKNSKPKEDEHSTTD